MPQRALPAFFLVALLLAPARLAPAQESGMPSDIEWKLAELGAVIDPAETAKLYTPLQETEPYQGIKVARDLKYGTDERHALDVFAPEPASAAPRAVLMYVHGGAFIGGNKRAPGSPFFDNIVLFAARSGFVGVNVTYRLAPQHRWPAGAEDVAAAVRWVGANIAAHGGDPGRVFLMGHSAGAVHAASYVAHPKFHGPRGIGLAGAILVSGLYDFSKFPPGPPEKAYFGDDDGQARRGLDRGPAAGNTHPAAGRLRRARSGPVHRAIQAHGRPRCARPTAARACWCCPSTATCPRSTPSTPRTARSATRSRHS